MTLALFINVLNIIIIIIIRVASLLGPPCIQSAVKLLYDRLNGTKCIRTLEKTCHMFLTVDLAEAEQAGDLALGPL